MPTQTELARKQRKELDALDAKNLEAIADAYKVMYDRLQGDVDALMLAIEDLDNPTAAEIKRLPQYKNLMKRAERELDRFTVYLETTIAAAGLASVGLGLAHSEQLINLSGAKFKGLDTRAMTALLDYLREDGKLYGRLKMLTGATVDQVVMTIIDGVGKGFNPRKVADLIQDAFGRGLTDALRNTRTVQLYAYRDSARANYMATNGLVTQWIWWAELDADVCMSCAAQHGTLHDLDETLDDHYNGRCAALPYIPEFGNPTKQTGQEWFDSLSEKQKREMMGNSKFDAYTAGKFTFDKLSVEKDNDVYGKMRTEASLKELLGE